MTELVKTPLYSFALIQPPPGFSFPYHFTFRMCFIDILYSTFSADIDIAVQLKHGALIVNTSQYILVVFPGLLLEDWVGEPDYFSFCLLSMHLALL